MQRKNSKPPLADTRAKEEKGGVSSFMERIPDKLQKLRIKGTCEQVGND